MSAPAIDLNRRDFEHRRGPIRMIGTWLLQGTRWEPCMVLLRDGEERSEQTVPCIIPLSRAWIWDVGGVGDPRQAARTATEFIDALRLTHSEATHRWLFGFIHDFIEDLLVMPPLPPADAPRTALAEVTITRRDTGKTQEVLLRDV